MQIKIEELKKSFADALALAGSAEALEALRVEYLGKKGHVVYDSQCRLQYSLVQTVFHCFCQDWRMNLP